FGKHIQAQSFPEWASHYMNYKGLKKIINDLNSTVPEDSPREILSERLERVKASFFFQLDRELEKVNAFYLQKERDMEQRLKVLINKQHAIEKHMSLSKVAIIHTLDEALRQFQRDLDKLQNFIEINGTGFRKILKKWDKRSKSSTKELYLAHQVEIQPCFNKDMMTDLTDTVARALVEIGGLLDKVHQYQQERSSNAGEIVVGNRSYFVSSAQGRGPPSVLTDMANADPIQRPQGLDDLEEEKLYSAIKSGRMQEVYGMMDKGKSSDPEAYRESFSRVLWRLCSTSDSSKYPVSLFTSGMVDFYYCDEIIEQTFCHKAAICGNIELLKAAAISIDLVNGADCYNRRPLHYASINGHTDSVEFLLKSGADVGLLDDDGNRPLDYAVLGGHVGCTKLLLESHISKKSLSFDDPLLCLACRRGHYDITLFLLDSGMNIVPNPQGLHPLHITCREGFVELSRLLLQRGSAVDPTDGDLGWTPLFYAASEGNIECLRVLLSNQSKLGVIDESGRSAIYYAANDGHISCVELLLSSGGVVALPVPLGKKISDPARSIEVDDYPQANSDGAEGVGSLEGADDPDDIPSLLLPPPIIPFRIYGHTFLNQESQVTIKLLHRSKLDRFPQYPVILHGNSHLKSLRLVVTGSPDAGMVPQTVMLPLDTDEVTLGFQTRNPSDFGLEFSLYPSFGTEVIGKAVTSSSLFSNSSVGCVSLAVLDRQLKHVADISFDFSIIQPFAGAQLEIGGKVETYWKSTNPLTGGPGTRLSSPKPTLSLLSPRSTTPAYPATPSAASGAGGSGGISLVTASSLSLTHISLNVQVTGDGVPVVWPSRTISVYGDIGVLLCQLTYDQFYKSIVNLGQVVSCQPPAEDIKGSPEAWQKWASGQGLRLDKLLEILPAGLGISIHVNLATPAHLCTGALQLSNYENNDINCHVDSILRVMYDDAQKRMKSSAKATRSPTVGLAYEDNEDQQRSIMFVSNNPVVCMAINWKQPNYPVFLKTSGRKSESYKQGPSAVSGTSSLRALQMMACCDQTDLSLKEAIRFAIENNLLGIMCEASLLVNVPHLIANIKSSGLVLASYGAENSKRESVDKQRHYGVDIIEASDVLYYDTPEKLLDFAI
ncbi:phosphate system positive regulatory protein pho81, partial [Mycoemilia scoparia]